MILIALGANLPSPAHGAPLATLETAMRLMPEFDVAVLRRSSWYENPAVPPSNQPPYINAVVEVRTELAPERLLDALHQIEARLGRSRKERWEARFVDLDLLDYQGRVRSPDAASPLQLPHPRLHLRAFTLVPIAELAPDWHHPISGHSVSALIRELEPAAVAAMRPLSDG